MWKIESKSSLDSSSSTKIVDGRGLQRIADGLPSEADLPSKKGNTGKLGKFDSKLFELLYDVRMESHTIVSIYGCESNSLLHWIPESSTIRFEMQILDFK